MSHSESDRSPQAAAKSISLTLPPDVLAALDRFSKQSGQPQSQLLIAALRRGLGLSRKSEVSQEDVAQLEARLAALEALPERVAQLEAQVDRLTQVQPPEPPAVGASPEEAAFDLPHLGLLDTCPKCDRPLGPPLKASGRQVCAKCGWSDKPRASSSATDLPSDELKQLLDQAAIEAMTNMKPKGKQNSEPQPRRFPLFGR